MIQLEKKLLTRLRLGFSQLNDHKKFNQGFRDISNPLCPCSIEVQTTTHRFLRYHLYNAKRFTLINDLIEVGSFSTLIDNNVIDLVLYGSDIFYDKKNNNIFMITENFIKDLMNTYHNFRIKFVLFFELFQISD